MTAFPRQRLAALAALALLSALLWPSSASAASALTGTLRLSPGTCSGSGATGTYFRMILADGSPTGPFLSNSDSPCSDQSYTPLQPGSDGGLQTGRYQPHPNPPFDAEGNALASRITRPAKFYGTGFATSTNSVDPQTRTRTPFPAVTASGSTLTADLSSFSVTWNKQYFNQGSPKPNGSYPGNTRAAKGTYDASTGAFTLQWTSQIVGGPFDKFTGLWHLTGTFVPSGGTSAGGSTGSASTGGAPVSSGAPQPGQASAAPRTTTGAAPSASPAASASASGQPTLSGAEQVASTRTTTSDSWSVRWWLVVLAVAIAVLGFTGLALLQRRISSAEEQS
jgi:hypothetical protein